MRTIEHEKVTIPNGSVLADSGGELQRRRGGGGFRPEGARRHGYDVDWRTVHRLMLEAARTEHILTDPAPQVWQTNLGDYAVQYGTARLDGSTGGHVRDALHPAAQRSGCFQPGRGRGLMTPSILGHRDASGLAIPQEAFPDRPARGGIAVDVNRRD